MGLAPARAMQSLMAKVTNPTANAPMPTFETPPDWWLSLANLTTWINWQAWAAIFTFLALLNTARLADQNRRDVRRKDAVFLTVAKELLAEVHDAVEDARESVEAYNEKKFPSREQRKQLSLQIKSIWEEAKAFERLDAVKASDFPSVHTYMVFSTAEIVCGVVRSYVSRYPDEPNVISDIDNGVKEIKDAMQILEREAEARHPSHRDIFSIRTGTGRWSMLARISRIFKPLRDA